MFDRLPPSAPGLRPSIIVGMFLILTLQFGCHSADGDTPAHSKAKDVPVPVYTGEGPIRVTCTVGMLADIVAAVGGERVAVKSLMGPGTDPHLYLATPGDRKKLHGSDTIFYCGHHLEGKMSETLARFARQTPTLAVCEKIDPSRLLRDEGGKVVDPHLWFDVTLWIECTNIVRDRLCEFDPSTAPGYRERASSYVQELQELHTYVTTRAQEIAAPQRVMVTAHDAFRYFGQAYGFEVLGIQGLSTDSEPAVSRINQLVEEIVTRGVKAVFVESTISEKNVRSLVEGCRARGHHLQIGGSLYSDAMGGAGSGADTYVGMVRHNIDTIVEALR